MTKLIAITGGSGAGKTTIAYALARRLGPGAVVISEDDYYLCSSTVAGFDRETYNFDVPSAKDHPLLEEQLALAKSGVAFDKPLYDQEACLRKPELERIVHADFVIVEGLHLLITPALRALFDVSAFIHADEALRLGRRMIRDAGTRARNPRSVMSQFFTNVRPMHEKYVEPQRAFADMVIISPYEADPAHADTSAAQIADRLK